MPPLNVREVVWEEESPSEGPVYKIFFKGRWTFVEGGGSQRDFSFRPLGPQYLENALNAGTMTSTAFFLE